MKPSATRVARDWNETEMEREAKGFLQAFARFAEHPDRWTWVAMVRWGQNLVPWLIETRSIPAGKAKAAELAYRLIGSARRTPKDIAQWVHKNDRHLRTFLAALSWPRKSEAAEGSDEVFPLEGFTIHNTLQLGGKELENTKKVVEKAVRAIKKMGVPNATGIPYGNLFIVGRLQQPKTLAWYNSTADEVYLRPHVRLGEGELHNLIHELGHRYWFKLMQSGKKRLWNNYFMLLDRMETKPPEMPKVGDPIPIPVRGHKTPPIVAQDTGEHLVLDTGGAVNKRNLWKVLRQTAQAEKFPTPYAATSSTEHFAEAFAMYALDTMGEDHKRAFKTIVIDGEPFDPAAPSTPTQVEQPPADPRADLRVKAREAVSRMTGRPTDEMLEAWMDGYEASMAGKPYGDSPRGRMARYWQAGFYAQSWKDPKPPQAEPTPEPPAPEPEPQSPLLTALLELKEKAKADRKDSSIALVAYRAIKNGHTFDSGNRRALAELFVKYGLPVPDEFKGDLPRPEPPPPVPETGPAEAGPRNELPRQPGELLAMVRELEDMARRRRTKKVLSFVEDIREALEKGQNLGPRREKRLTRLMQSYGLLVGPEATRVASRYRSRQVASRYLARRERRTA